MRRVMERFLDSVDDHLIVVISAGFALLLSIAFLLPLMAYNIPAGHIGVYWRRFGGTVMKFHFGEGLHVIWPWNRIIIYDARLQVINSEFLALTSDELQIGVTISFRYMINPLTIGLLHQYVGPDYLKKVVLPEMQSHTREEIAKESAAEVYDTRRDETEEAIRTRAEQEFVTRDDPEHPNGIQILLLQDVSLRNVTLPESLQAIIVAKAQESQRVELYQLKLHVEQLEAQRKRIEAEGINAFQTAIQGGISSGTLQWKGIEATLALAESPNAKTLVVGGGRGGLPIILNDGAPVPSLSPGTMETAPVVKPSVASSIAGTVTDVGGTLLLQRPLPGLSTAETPASISPTSATPQPSVPPPGHPEAVTTPETTNSVER